MDSTLPAPVTPPAEDVVKPTLGYLFVRRVKCPWGYMDGSIEIPRQYIDEAPSVWVQIVGVPSPVFIDGKEIKSRYNVGDVVCTLVLERIVMGPRIQLMTQEGHLRGIIPAGGFIPEIEVDTRDSTLSAVAEFQNNQARANLSLPKPKIAM